MMTAIRQLLVISFCVVLGCFAVEDFDVESATQEPPILPPVPAKDPSNVGANVTEDGVVCILIEMRARFIITYPVNATFNDTRSFNLPVNASHEGSCNKTSSAVYLQNIGYKFVITDDDGDYDQDDSFGDFDAAKEWEFILTFNEKDGSFSISDIDLIVPFEDPYFPFGDGKTRKFNVTDQELYKSKNANAYTCNSKQSLSTTLENAYQADIDFYSLKFQAFRDKDSAADFGPEFHCDADQKDTDIVVPIAVGVALAVLIIIVVIAYLIGSRKRRPAYQQVE